MFQGSGFLATPPPSPGVASKISVRLGLLAGRAGWQRWLATLDALDGGHELLAGVQTHTCMGSRTKTERHAGHQGSVAIPQ